MSNWAIQRNSRSYSWSAWLPLTRLTASNPPPTPRVLAYLQEADDSILGEKHMKRRGNFVLAAVVALTLLFARSIPVAAYALTFATVAYPGSTTGTTVNGINSSGVVVGT